MPALLLGAAVAGGGIGVMSLTGKSDGHTSPSTAYAGTATHCRVVDGDTLHCDGGRIRLLGIDAPELPGHCAQGRECAPGDPVESSRSLEDGMGDGANLKVQAVGTDRCGRMLAMVRGRGGDLSCWQLAHGEALYKPRWDNDGRVGAACPTVAR